MRPFVLPLALILSATATLLPTGRAGAAFTVTSPDPTLAIGYYADPLDPSTFVGGALPVPAGGFVDSRAILFGTLQIHSDYAVAKTSLIVFDIYVVNGTTPDVLMGSFGAGVTNLLSDGSLVTDFSTSQIIAGFSPSQLNPTLDVGTTQLTFYLTNFRETEVPQPAPAPAGLVLFASALPFAAILRRRGRITG